MSMLAEPRRKANWVLNPRNTHWTADTSKFGLRLMEKMGWSQGSGLGANAQGSTEHIKVAVRSDNRGVGFKDRAEDELLQQLDYAELLKQLASETPPLESPEDEGKTGEIASLEEKSQKSRSRVHYRKFTRGKDLSLYSEQDLASILGKPAPKLSAKKVIEQEATFQSDVATVGGGCMLDYFRKKMAASRSEVKQGDASALQEIAEENENNVTDVNIETNVIQRTESKKEKKKSKKRSKDCETVSLEQNVNDMGTEVDAENMNKNEQKIIKPLEDSDQGTVTSLTNSEVCAETKKEKKRKRKDKKESEDGTQVTPRWEVRDTTNIEVDAKTTKKETQKTKKALEDSSQEEIEGLMITECCVETKKEKKRKRKAEKALKHCGQEAVGWEVTDLTNSQVDDGKSKKDKRQKARKSSENCEHETVDVKNASLNEEIVEVKKERKRKHKKVAVDEDCDDNKTNAKLNGPRKEVDSFEGTQASYVQLPEVEEKKTSKKIRESSVQVTIESEVRDTGAICEVGTKKRKEKRHKSKNPLEEPQQVTVENKIIDAHEEAVCAVDTKKTKKKKRKSDECDQTQINEETSLVENENSGTAEFKKEKKHKKRKRNPEQNSELKEDVIADAVIVGETVIVEGLENDVSKPKKEKKGRKRKRDSEESIELKGDMIVDAKPAKRREVETEDNNADFKHQKEVGDVENKTSKSKKEKKSKKVKRNLEESTKWEEHIGADMFVDYANSADLNHHDKTTKHVREIENNSADLIHQEESSAVVGQVDDNDCSADSKKKEVSNVVCQVDDNSADRQAETPVVLGEEKNDNKPCKEEIVPEVVELNGTRYINGICNYDLPCPVIDKMESTSKIQPHLRDTVEFETILGANNEKFHYAGLLYQYVKQQAV